jgi:hypothetical protein
MSASGWLMTAHVLQQSVAVGDAALGLRTWRRPPV